MNTSKAKLIDIKQNSNQKKLNSKFDEQNEILNKISTIKHDLKSLSKLEGEEKLIYQNNLVLKYKFKEQYDLNIIKNDSQGKMKVILRINNKTEIQRRNCQEIHSNSQSNQKNNVS